MEVTSTASNLTQRPSVVASWLASLMRGTTLDNASSSRIRSRLYSFTCCFDLAEKTSSARFL